MPLLPLLLVCHDSDVGEHPPQHSLPHALSHTQGFLIPFFMIEEESGAEVIYPMPVTQLRTCMSLSCCTSYPAFRKTPLLSPPLLPPRLASKAPHYGSAMGQRVQNPCWGVLLRTGVALLWLLCPKPQEEDSLQAPARILPLLRGVFSFRPAFGFSWCFLCKISFSVASCVLPSSLIALISPERPGAVASLLPPTM